MNVERGESPPEASPQLSAHREIERRARVGAIALTLRTAVAQLIILGGTVVMARNLRPAEFGAFAIIQFVLRFISTFGDVGLAGALIQKKEAPRHDELSSVFFLQAGLGAAVLVVGFAIGNLLPSFWRDLPASTPLIMLAVAFNFFFTSLRVVPTLLMERELLFVRLSLLDTVVSALFYLVAALLSLRGFGIWALALAVSAQGLGGLIAAYILRPFRPNFAFDWRHVRSHLPFGLTLQGRSLVWLFSGAVIPVVAGTLLGSEAVGYLNWSHETAYFPLTFVEILARVNFPLYSRMLANGGSIRSAVETQLRVCAAITFFFSAMFFGLGEPLTRVIFSETWVPAVPFLQFYAIAITIGILLHAMSPAFDAAGKPSEILKQMLAVVLATWLAVPIFTLAFGITGFAASYCAVTLAGGIGVWWRAKRAFGELSIVRAFVAPAATGVLVALVGLKVVAPWVTSPMTLAAAVVSELLLYLLILALFDRKSLQALLSLAPKREAVQKTT